MTGTRSPSHPICPEASEPPASSSAAGSARIGRPTESTHIVFCCNSRYIRHMAVAAVSLLINNPHRTFVIHLILTDRDSAEIRKLEQTLAKFANATLEIYGFDVNIVADFYIAKHLTIDTYVRLFLADVLEDEVDRVIYLDSDLVVLGTIDPLCDLELGSRVVAGAPDCNDADRRGSLQLDGPDPYVNAGVLVIDLERWRKNGFSKRAQEIALGYYDRLKFFDQDVINVMLRGSIWTLGLEWNLSAWRMRRYLSFHRRRLWRHEDARRRAVIVHFVGHEKPWRFASIIPCKAVYWRYRRETEWRTIRDGEFSTVRCLAFPIRLLLHVSYINPKEVQDRLGWLWRSLLLSIEGLGGLTSERVRPSGLGMGARADSVGEEQT